MESRSSFDEAALTETPHFFRGGEADLFGIVTHPSAPPLGVGVVLMTARGTYHRSRLSVRLARRLAARGYHVMRFDFQGVGESRGEASFELERPLTGDVEGAVRVLKEAGLERFVLVGSCFGARSALAAAEKIDPLIGLVLAVLPGGETSRAPAPGGAGRWRRLLRLMRRVIVDPASRPVFTHVVRGQLHRRWGGLKRRLSPAAARAAPAKRQLDLWLERLLERGVALLLLFGAEDEVHRDLMLTRDSWPPALRRSFDELAQIRVASRHDIHGPVGIQAQEWLLQTLEDWLVRLARGQA